MRFRNILLDFGEKYTPFRILFLMDLALYAIAIPFSKFLMTLAGLILVGNWFLEGFFERNLWKKFAQAAKSKIILAMLLIFFVHLLWFIPTENFAVAFREILTKTPLFFFPIIFYTSKPLNRNEINSLLSIYVLGVLFSSLFGFFSCLQQELSDMRKMAVYISYVRFELNVCFAIFVSLYLLLQKNRWGYAKSALLLPLVWFLFLQLYAGFMTGIILLIIITFVFILKAAFLQKRRIIRYGLFGLFLAVFGGISLFIYIRAKNYFTVPPFDSTATRYTADGNPYNADFDRHYIENGNYIFAYICEQELEQAWNKRSQIDYNELSNTLIRYLNSKGLHKDRISVEALTEEEIANIENGIANIAYTHDFSVVKRIYELFWEINAYRQTGAVVGGSLSQRLELWQVSFSAIKKHPLFGVGTGDARAVFAKELEEQNSPLAFSDKRSHNQYLTFWIAFGIVGLCLILFSLFYPVIALKKLQEPLFLAFFLIIILSLFTEDGLEQQDGMTLFAFFYSLFLFWLPKNDPLSP